MTVRLQEKYNNDISKSLKAKFNYKNDFEIPKLEKIVINMGKKIIYKMFLTATQWTNINPVPMSYISRIFRILFISISLATIWENDSCGSKKVNC